MVSEIISNDNRKVLHSNRSKALVPEKCVGESDEGQKGYHRTPRYVHGINEKST